MEFVNVKYFWGKLTSVLDENEPISWTSPCSWEAGSLWLWVSYGLSVELVSKPLEICQFIYNIKTSVFNG